MSLLNSYMQKEQLMKQLSEELKQLESDSRLKQELEFKDRLEQLMREFSKSSKDVLDVLDPKREFKASKSESSTGGRRRRKLKVYKNPHTGEIVETRGGNQKTLKAWKEEHGEEAVEGWLAEERD